MNKKKIIILLIVVVGLGAGLSLFFLDKDSAGRPTSQPTEIASYDPAEYEKCVNAGGLVNVSIAPKQCFINNKLYYDGNY